MFFNYIKLAFRGLLRDTTYAAINIGGLASGIAASILLMMWVTDELSFDSFHKKHERIFKVNANFENNGNPMTWSTTPAPTAVFAKQQIAAVQEAVRISATDGSQLYRYNDKEFVESRNAAYVDQHFFSVFDFKLTKGNKDNPFPDTKSIVISETLAKKYFENEEAMGKILRLDNKEDFVITGIMEDMPENSSIRYSILFPFEILIKDYKANEYWKTLESNWGNYFYQTFLLLDPSASPNEVAKQLSDIHHKNQAEAGVIYSFQPLGKLHLYAADMSEAGIQTVRIFLIVAIAILLIACINYLNLATARASKRAKEVGIRKTVGADRSRLIFQFLTESAIISTLALTLSIILIQGIIPFYNLVSGKNLSFELFNSSVLILVLGALTLTWLIAGVYPALVLSSFQPVQVIRGKLTLSGGNSTFRKILVVTQFTLSIAIIIATLVVGQQLNFIRAKNLGYNKDNVFVFEMRGEMENNSATIKNELLKQPGIISVTTADQNIMNLSSTTGDTDWEGKPKDQGLMIHPMNIDENYLATMNLALVEGSGFTGAKADTLKYILNETAIKEAGITDPIGKSFSLWNTKGIIAGVVKDFHHRSIHKKIEPTIFYYNPKYQWTMYVKTDGVHNEDAISATEKAWKKYNASYPFDFNFLDSYYDKMYKSEQRMSKLFTAFSVITIVISCLGLFGLTTFTVTQRVKEIGIRKVMGASVNQIVAILSKDFLKLVLIALLLAAPISYFFMNNWLQDFAYRIEIDWTMFIAAGALALLIAFITMSFQTIRAALSNPVDSLRNE